MDLNSALWMLTMQIVRFETWKEETKKTLPEFFATHPFEVETYESAMAVLKERAMSAFPE